MNSYNLNVFIPPAARFSIRNNGYNGTEVFAVTGDGKVGIGTTSPAQKLTVAGTIESTSGGVKLPDGTVQTTASAPTWHQILPAAQRFVLVMNNNEAVLDKETGLVWEKSPTSNTSAWTAAISYCRGKAVGSRKGWRLPTVEELASLVDTAMSNPALPSGHPFINAQAVGYWSVTTGSDDTFNTERVDFAYVV